MRMVYKKRQTLLIILTFVLYILYYSSTITMHTYIHTYINIVQMPQYVQAVPLRGGESIFEDNHQQQVG